MEERIVEEEDIPAGHPGEYDHHAERIVGERLEYGDFLHLGDRISGEDFRRAIIIEFLESERAHLPAWHIPDIREIDRIYGDETDHDEIQVLSRIGEGELEPFQPGAFYGCSESVADCHDAEYRQDEYGGEFDGLGESEDDAGDDEIFRGWVFEKTDEEIGRDEYGGRDAEIGRHVVRVSDDVRIESEEKNREKSRDRSGGFLGESIQEIRREKAEQDDRKTGEKDDEVGIVAEII